MKRITYALGLVAVLAILIAGCGGSDDNGGGGYGGGNTAGSESDGGYGGGNPSPSPESGGGAGVVTTAQVGDLGTILVGSEGHALYDFHKDKGTTSSCYGACAETWPPLLSEGEPQAKGGASAGMLGTTKRNDGTVQVTYAGHPLYTYVGDKAPGEANGNNIDQFGAEWYALQPDGEEPED